MDLRGNESKERLLWSSHEVDSRSLTAVAQTPIRSTGDYMRCWDILKNIGPVGEKSLALEDVIADYEQG